MNEEHPSISYDWRDILYDKDEIKKLLAENERLKAEIARLQKYLPSTQCKLTHVQKCHWCDDESCCDNTSEGGR